MKKIISILLALMVCFSAIIVPVGAIEGTYVTYFVGETQDGAAVTGLNAGDTYLPSRMPATTAPDGKYFVGWADASGEIVGNEGFVLANGENKLYAVYKDYYVQVNANLKDAVNSTLTRNIGFMKKGEYLGQVTARTSGSASLKYVEASSENYLEIYPGASNAGGTLIPLADDDGDIIQGKWSTKYSVTVVYRIPENKSTAALKFAFGGQINRTADTYHQAPTFRNQYGNEGGNIKLGDYWSVTEDSGLTRKWHDNGGYMYRFGDSVENPATTDGWKSVTFTGITGAQNENFLPLFGLYVNVGSNTAAQKVQIKSVTVVDMSNAVVKYVANGQTDSMDTGIAVGETYKPNRLPGISAPEGKYFVGWADANGDIVSEGITVEGGETVLTAVYKDYPGKEYVAFNWDNFPVMSGNQKVYAPSLDANSENYSATTNAYNRGYGVVQTVTENGETYLKPTVTTTWGQRQAIVLADDDGVAYQIKPNTKYTVTVRYKVPNFVSSNVLAVAAGINLEKRGNAGEPVGLCKYYANATYTDPSITSTWVYNVWKDGGYNDYRVTAASENWQTITFTLDIGDLSGTLPVIVFGIELGGMSGSNATELLIKDIIITSSDYKEPVTAEYYDGDTLLLSESVMVGSNIREEIEVEGKIFDGWYVDKELTVPASATIMDNIALYGKYLDASQTVNVTYIYNDTVLKDAKAQILSKVWDGKNAVTGKTLFGWYTDEALTQRYIQTNVGLKDLTLYGDFIDYTTDYEETSWPTYFSSINCYSEYNGSILTSFSAGGWNWGDAKAVSYNNCLLLANRNTWGQGGGVILHDAETGDILVPEPSSLYEVSIEYTVPKLDATSVSVSLGFGYDKAKSNSLSNIAPSVSSQVGEFSEATTEIQTATFTYNVPESTGDILPCFVISASFGGRVDTTNNAPVSYIAVSKVTIKKIEVKGLNYGGASILKEEVADEYNQQALRVYFDYKLDNENMMVAADGTKYNIKERGVLIKGYGVSDASLVVDNVGKDGVRGIRKISDFDKGWAYDSETGTVTYSVRVSGLQKSDTRRIQFRGYVVLDNNMICYSDISTISVNDIENAVDTDKPAKGEKEKVAIIMVIGQSNAQGAGYGEEKEIVKVTNGMWEISATPTTTDYGAVYLSNTGAVTSLSPEYEYSTNWAEKVGGYGPAMAARWYELTGDKVVVLQMAVGATGLAEWQKDANSNREHYKELSTPGDDRGYNGEYYLYKRAVKAFNETYEQLSGNYEITTAFYTWNQGENAESRTNPDENTIYNDATYAEYYEKMHNDFMADCPGLEFGTITAVRSCRNTSHSQNKWNVAGVTTNARRAQYRLASKLDDLYFVSWHTETATRTAPGSFQTSGISEPTWGGNYDLVPSFKGCSYGFSNMHMTQLNYNIIGKESAENLLNSLNGEINFDGVAVRDGDANLVGKFDENGEGVFSITNDNTTRTQYLQIRPEDASCTYDFSLSVDTEKGQLVIDLYTDLSHHASGDDYVTEYGEINWAELEKLGISTLEIVCNVN